jgi:hypothetical protein
MASIRPARTTTVCLGNSRSLSIGTTVTSVMA